MTGEFWLDWAMLAVSLFNTVLLIWLGLTVWLNAERTFHQAALSLWGRRLGVWITSGGLLTGGVFFISHSAILGHGDPGYASLGMEFWWRTGWVPAIVLPMAWYVVVLWYTGFWDNKLAALHRRQRPWLAFVTLLGGALIGLLLVANPLPSYQQVTQLELAATPAISGIPLLILAYPLYIILCISLSLDALRRPGPSGRVMGDLARRRARPWLVAASIALLLVSLLVGWVMFRVIVRARQHTLFYTDMAISVAKFDLAIAALIAVAVTLMGQAIISYEIFTGKTLPRRGFRRHWLNTIILAGGYSVLISWCLTIQLRPVYSLLLSVVLLATFYALLTWRSFGERERAIEHLRPFVASQRLYEHLLQPTSPIQASGASDVAAPFHALCQNVLGARVAYLVPLGPLASLASATVAYPAGQASRLPDVAAVAAELDSPQTMCAALNPGDYNGAAWAVPLWSERGLIGMLLLGPKQDGGLYTQEEIEIARASGERLIDMQASAEMSSRLMALQRQRLAESQVLDQRTRRALHDDVLPRLHTAMLSLNSTVANPDETISAAVDTLAKLHRQISDLLHALPAPAAPQISRLGLIGALQRAVDGELAGAFDDVAWHVEAEAERWAHALPPLAAEVIFGAAREAARNAARHGRGARSDSPLHLWASVSWRDGLEIVVEDDGVGLAGSQPDQGKGQGLALHSTLMAVIGGSLAIESAANARTRVRLSLPSSSLPIY
jgi:signal transduction histidine kinase